MFCTMFLAVSFLFATDEAAYLDRIDSLRNDDGMFLDRRSDTTTVSAAATGFGMMALAEGANRGLRDKAEVAALARKAFAKTVGANPRRNRGWLSHFTDAAGNPKSYSEISTIDTAIFYAGLKRTAQLCGDPALEDLVNHSLQEIDVNFVMRDGVFLHGFYWNTVASSSVQRPAIYPASYHGNEDPNHGNEDPNFIPYKWNDSSEGMILYRLFDLPFPLKIRRLDYPLFVYAYPLCFYEDAMYEGLLQDAIADQISRFGYWGVTSTDGPLGYVTLDQNVISPVLIGAITTKYPQYLDPLKSLAIQTAVVSMHLPSGWTGHDDLTIDLASAYTLFARWSDPVAEEHKVFVSKK